MWVYIYIKPPRNSSIAEAGAKKTVKLNIFVK